MRISNTGLELIKHFEGFSPVIYKDVAGHPTIGYGHLLREGKLDQYREGISEQQAGMLLKQDVKAAEWAVSRFIGASLTQYQFDALASFTFNLGSGALQRSTLRRVINRGEHEKVETELLRWVFAGGRRFSGLIRRRQAEATLYNSGALVTGK